MIWLTLGGCIFSSLVLVISTLPSDNVTYMFQSVIKTTNPLIPQRAGVIPMPTGSHYIIPRFCASLIHGARGPSRKTLACIY